MIPLMNEWRSWPVARWSEVAEAAKAHVLATTRDKAGHIASSFGVAELTVALHGLLNTPEDLLLWDVGHQAYIHKVLTDRAPIFQANRQPGGPSGFPRRSESPFDAWGVGHSSTALSAAVGFARADRALGTQRHRVAVVGDGAMTGGMVYEALNDGGGWGADVLLVINDNGMAIEENVGALHRGGPDAYRSLVESLGWTWVDGRVDGHDLPAVVGALERALALRGPRVLHVRTRRPSTAELGLSESAPGPDHFQSHFAAALASLAATDPRIHALTAAMAPGCSLDVVREQFPDRVHDVGIAEPHCITAAAAMAAAGLRPVVNLYSTFSQRALDQWIHDVALQKLPVILCLDRAGMVGEDGATHHGVFDLAMFRAVPHTAIWAPRDGHALREALDEALAYGGPSIIRYPKGAAPRYPDPLQRRGGMDWMRSGTGVAHFALGSALSQALEAAATSHSVIDLRRAKPIDPNSLHYFARNHHTWHVWEDAQAINGVGQALASWLLEQGYGHIALHRHGYRDQFVDHAPREAQMASAKRT
ncbi:MAG: 1-deoxy-D-xylulose-5-phosphate synthase N-terminal domain-containing protein [Schleiferiaceae bacterium]